MTSGVIRVSEMFGGAESRNVPVTFASWLETRNDPNETSSCALFNMCQTAPVLVDNLKSSRSAHALSLLAIYATWRP